MKTKFAKLLVACSLLWAASAHAISNPGFETGDLTDWTSVGNVTVVGSFGGYTAPEGSWMAMLSTDTPAINDQISIVLQGFAALSSPMTFMVNFLSYDYMPFNDFVSFNWTTNISGSETGSMMLDVADFTTPFVNTETLRSTGWKYLTLPTGTTSFSATINNVADTGVHSFALIDIAPIPEPGEWALMLAGLGLIGTMVRRRSASRAV